MCIRDSPVASCSSGMRGDSMSSAPDPHDFLAIGSLLSDEERLIRETVRQFVTDKVLPDVADWFEAGTFPTELATEMGALGLLGMHLDGYGCAGTCLLYTSDAADDLTRVDLGGGG